jgi:dolichyl-phosphate-mannose-protein mannosyltransferase
LGSRPGRRLRVLAHAGLFVLGFAIRSLHAADLAPVLDTPRQPGLQMTRRYDVQAVDMLYGDGILFPRVPDPEDTGLLSRPPGYALLLAATYRLAGRDIATTQLLQNLLCSLTGPLLLLLGSAVLSFRVGTVAGAFAAVAPHFAWYSNWIVPDAPCVIAVVAGLLLSWQGLRPGRSVLWQAAAGASLGAAVWLRPNLLLLGVFLGLGLVAARPGARRLKQGVVLAGASLLAVLPISVRNYVVFHRFVPVSINLGIVLWEGIADAGGERFGAVRTDPEVARQEARLYGDPRYRDWWAAPDGIARDHDRVKRSLALIRENPAWFARAMLGRMAQMLDYAHEAAPVVGEARFHQPEETEPSAPSARWNAPGRTRGLEPRLPSAVIRASMKWAMPLRPVVGIAQAVLRRSLTAATLLGVLLVGVVAPRRGVFLGAVPVSLLLLQAPLHLEFRVTLAMHAVLALFAASAWLIAAAALRTIMVAAWTSRSRAPTHSTS